MISNVSGLFVVVVMVSVSFGSNAPPFAARRSCAAGLVGALGRFGGSQGSQAPCERDHPLEGERLASAEHLGELAELGAQAIDRARECIELGALEVAIDGCNSEARGEVGDANPRVAHEGV
jgi:hypothetical protein